MLLIMIFPFLHMLNLDVHGQAFRDLLQIVPQTFDQHTGVAFYFINPLVNLAEPFVNACKLPVMAV